MSPSLEPEESYESIRASILEAYARDARKAIVLKMGAFTLIFAILQPSEAWERPRLGGTLVTIGAAYLAQYLIYRGAFRVVSQWVFERYPSPRGVTVTWAILGAFVVTVVLSIRLFYELACMSAG